jgi:hypothetical protein
VADEVTPATVERVAVRLGVDPAGLTPLQRERIEEALIDARTKVEEEIGRGALIQRAYVLTGQRPVLGYELTDWRAWPQTLGLDDFVEVVSATPELDDEDRFTVRLLLGIDALKEAPIQRFIIADAVASLSSDPTAKIGERAVRSVSAEGQSITWVDAPTQVGLAGAAPSLTMLRRYKRKVWQQSVGSVARPWPYS